MSYSFVAKDLQSKQSKRVLIDNIPNFTCRLAIYQQKDKILIKQKKGEHVALLFNSSPILSILNDHID